MPQTTQNKFLIDKLKIEISEKQKKDIRDIAARMFKYHCEDNLPAVNFTEFIHLKDIINTKYLIGNWSFILFKEVMPHIDDNYKEFDFLTIPILIDGGPFYFGDTYFKKEYQINIGGVFRVRTMNYHWINTADIDLLNNTNFCVTLQYTIEKRKFNKDSQEILKQIKK